MPRMICLETNDGEVFVNLDLVSRATATTDSIAVHFADGQTKTFTGPAAHTMIQALRHEEKRTAQNG